MNRGGAERSEDSKTTIAKMGSKLNTKKQRFSPIPLRQAEPEREREVTAGKRAAC